MLQTIVVAVNDLKQAEEVIAQAAALATAFSAQVFVVGIIEQMNETRSERFTDPVLWNMIKSETQATLNRHVQNLQDQGIEASLELIEASTTEALLQHLEEIPADLIVLAYQHETPPPLIRSILKYSKTPVFLSHVDQMQSACSNILVPLDGSQRAESSLTLATAIARATQAQIHLVHVVQPFEMPRQTTLSTEVTEITQRLAEKYSEEAQRYLEQMASRLDGDVKIHVVTDGRVTSSLHNLIMSEGIDLLVLSAHGYSGEPQWPFGSVAENIINYCKVPTIVVQDLPALFSPPSVEPTRIKNGAH